MPVASRFLMLVGALQGILLWFLWHAADNAHWPQGEPLLMGALLWAVLAVPAAIYLSENAGFERARRWWLVAGVGVLYLFFGAYAGWLGDPVEAIGRQPRLIGPYGSFVHVLAALVLGFILVPLVAGYKTAGGQNGRWQYPLLFRLAWRNALLGASVAAITGLFWAVLFAGAMLMKSLGLRFVLELIEEPIFAFPVTGMVVGAVFAQGHARSELLVNLRQYWLSLNAWLLPLLLGFGVMWVVALPLTGLDTLFGTRSAAFILLWFAALAVYFINCAWQDGEQAPLYPRWLAAAVRYGWITLPVVTGVAGWALWLRIDQYGLTEERIWAAFIALLAAGYVLGYGLSLLPFGEQRRNAGRVWMGSLGGTNIFMAIITLLCLVLLASPVADPRRLAVGNQVARLQDGRIAPADFDYAYLRWRADRWGLLALQELAQATGDARVQDVAARARQMLEQRHQWAGAEQEQTGAVLTLDEARQRIRLLRSPGSEYRLPDELVAALRTQTGVADTRCLHPQHECAIWMQDFNKDGQQEALVLVAYSGMERRYASACLMAESQGVWQVVSQLDGMLPLAEWTEAIGAGKVRIEAPLWMDVVIDGKRVAVPGGTDGHR